MERTEEKQRYPIGPFRPDLESNGEKRAAWIEEISALPARLRRVLADLSEEELDTPYRSGGWTARQVVHHLADSHVNAYVRFRLALTEDNPSIKTYQEKRWAELPDARKASVQLSVDLLEHLHVRLVALLKSLSEEDFSRTFSHPEWGTVPLDVNLQLYAWHGKHHLAHIESVRRPQKRGA